MTNKEIITQLEDIKCHCQEMYEAEIKNADTSSSIWGKDVEALDFAIKALEQQPCEDCISRDGLLARIDEERKHLLGLKMDGAEHIIVHHARRIIEDMPSVTPKMDVLDKIRAEIEAEPYISKMEVLDIIDKYKAESEDREQLQ